MNTLKGWGQRFRQTRTRVAIIVGSTILVILLFKPIFDRVGSVGSALVTIPVAMAGLYFGITAGLITSFWGIVLSTLLLTVFGDHPWYTWIVIGWPGDLMLICVGYIAGSLQKEWARRMRLVDDLRYHERYLSLINIATRDILNPQKREDAYSVLITHLTNLYVADYAHFIRWDAAQEKAILAATTIPMEQAFSDIILDSNESGIITPVMETGSLIIIEDVSNSKYIVNPSVLSRILPSAQSALCIPLIAKEYKLGAVVLAFNHPRRFTSDEIAYAEQAGSQIALALYTSQQEHRIQEQLKEARALGNIGRALSETERVGIETVLQLIVDSAKELIPEAKEVVLHLLDDELQILVPRAVAGIENKDTKRLNMRLGEGVAGQAVQTGKVISIPDTQADPHFLNQATPVTFHSLIVAPIQRSERCVGTISIQSAQPYAFSAENSQLLGTLGVQAAIAIENANLLETTRQDLKEINALYRINWGLVASLDPDRLMKDVVNFLQKSFGYCHVQIYTLDRLEDKFIASQGSGKIGTRLKKMGYSLPIGAGIIGYAAETSKPFMTNTADEVVFFVRNPLLPNTQSELTVPIIIEDQVVGVMDIQQAPPGRLTQRDLKLMSTVADQLAVALQRANLYADLQTSLKKEKETRSQLIQSERLAVAGRLLASVSHELNNPLQAIQNALFLLKDEEKLSVQGRQDMELVLSEAERMAIMLERLRATYRPLQVEDFHEIRLNSIIEDVHALTTTYMRHNGITFKYFPDPELPSIRGSHDQIRQVILNLCVNAIEAMPTGGTLTLSTQKLPEEDRILLLVTDTGTGIDSQILPHIFEPFVTSKETGTGLGLAITHDIIRQHNGKIQAENNPEGGATFKVWLPIKKKG